MRTNRVFSAQTLNLATGLIVIGHATVVVGATALVVVAPMVVVVAPMVVVGGTMVVVVPPMVVIGGTMVVVVAPMLVVGAAMVVVVPPMIVVGGTMIVVVAQVLIAHHADSAVSAAPKPLRSPPPEARTIFNDMPRGRGQELHAFFNYPLRSGTPRVRTNRC